MSSQASGQRKIMGNGDKSVTNNAHPRQHHKHNVNKQPQPCIDATLQLGAGCEAISAALMKLVPAARIINVQLVEPAERQATAGGFYLDVSVPDGDRHLIQLAALQEQVRAYASTRSPAVELLQVSVVVTGDKANEVSNHVIRLHAIAFNTSAQLTAWHQHRAEVLARDHRHIGAQQQLFMMDHRYAPGSLFVLPHGQHIVSRLKTLLRDEYRRLGYEEISTPLLYHTDLWMRSGHLENYKDDMFLVEGKRHGASVDGHTASHTFGLKPMSCPV